MYLFKHALQNLGRNKGRNILMAIILYVVLLAAAVSVIVNSSTAQLIEGQKARFGAPVNLVRDYRKIPPTLKYAHLLTAAELMRFTDSELLMKSQLSTALTVSIKELMKDDGEQAADADDAALVLLLSSLRKGDQDEFASGLREIVEGHAYQGAGQCVISRELAERSGLKTGQTITLLSNGNELDIGHDDAEKPQGGGEQESLALKIVGIYENHLQSNSTAEVTAEQVYMDFQTLVESKLYAASGALAESQMILKNPEALEDFTKELQEKGLPEYYNVNVDDSVYKKITKPLEGLKNITGTLSAAVTLFGAAVLLILSILSIRERKYEVGVLRAMGVKKRSVSLGLVTETVFLTVACLILATGSASVLSRPVGEMLLQTQTVSQSNAPQSNTNEQGDAIMPPNTGFAGLTAESSEQAELNAKLDGKSAAAIAWIALLLACAASAASIVFVTRFEPMKILSERN